MMLLHAVKFKPEEILKRIARESSLKLTDASSLDEQEDAFYIHIMSNAIQILPAFGWTHRPSSP